MQSRPMQAPRIVAPTAPLPERMRVTKTLRPMQPGTRKLVERYGDALVCVRHREGGVRTMRVVTVELVVETLTPTRRRGSGQGSAVVDVRIAWREVTLRAQAKALGAILDPITGLWRMTRRAAHTLGLTDCIE